MKNLILIVDDSDFNGEFLGEILKAKFDVHFVNNGKEAIIYMSEHLNDIYLLLLDIVMPEMDGFDVLTIMNKNGWINKIPVVMISSEVSSTYINHAFDLGAIDYLSRPFDAEAIFRRIDNAIHKFNTSITRVNSEEKDMIEVLSNLVEFRNGETGLHLLHIKVITDILLKRYRSLTNDPMLTDDFIALVSNASALHDIGKISIPYEILNKPGRLTSEEFAIMKSHSAYGAKMIKESPNYANSKLLKVAYEIARWHHEKIDGKGYPDGLVGNQIPIYVQAVSIADCYDALTSERCYKKAIPQDKSIQMIANGECGKFSDSMIKCLLDSKEELITLLDVQSPTPRQDIDFETYISSDITGANGFFSNKIKSQLDIDRLKNKYVYDNKNECVFEYDLNNSLFTFSILNFSSITDYKEDAVNDIKQQLIDYLSTLDVVEKFHISITTSSKDRVPDKIKLRFNDEVIEYYLLYTVFAKDKSYSYVGKIYKQEV